MSAAGTTSVRRLAVLLLLGLAGSRPLTAQHRDGLPAVSDAGEGRQSYVLISGLVGGVRGFRRLEQRLLAQGHRVVIIDPYRLSVDSPDVSFAALARRVETVLAERAVRDARVVAHAHGAGVALRLAAQAPERVSGLYFLDVGALASNGTGVLGTAIRIAPLIARMPGGRDFIRKRYIKGLRENSGTHEWLDAASQAGYTEPLLDNIDRVVALAYRLAGAKEPEPLASVVSRVTVPVSILLGGLPHPSGPDSAEMQALVPLGAAVRIARLESAGHFLHEEAPDAVARFVMTSFPTSVVSGESDAGLRTTPPHSSPIKATARDSAAAPPASS